MSHRSSTRLGEAANTVSSSVFGERHEYDLKVHLKAEFAARRRGDHAPESMTHV